MHDFCELPDKQHVNDFCNHFHSELIMHTDSIIVGTCMQCNQVLHLSELLTGADSLQGALQRRSVAGFFTRYARTDLVFLTGIATKALEFS